MSASPIPLRRALLAAPAERGLGVRLTQTTRVPLSTLQAAATRAGLRGLAPAGAT